MEGRGAGGDLRDRRLRRAGRGAPGRALALRSLGARILARRDGYRELRGAYLRVTRREDLPDLPDTDFVAVGPGLPVRGAREGAEASFAFLGPTPYGPPEKCWWEPALETDHPGLLWHSHGRGRSAYFRGRWTPCSTGTASRSRGPCWATPYGQ